MKDETIRYRTQFEKTKAMRYTGHLDLFRTLERTMRRANMPLAYSQGFNPRPKMTLASALPLGYTSESEMLDFWLKEDRPLDEIAKALHIASPPGIIFKRFETTPLRGKKLQHLLSSASFIATLNTPPSDLETRLADYLAAKEVLIDKIRKGKRKTIDLRALTITITLLPKDNDGQTRLELVLHATEGATGRPDDILKALDIDPLTARIHRTALIFND